MRPSVSVSLCTYNGSRFVAAQVRSILEQTLVATEIILSDDGSTDGTVEIVRNEVESWRESGRPTPTLRVLVRPEPLGVTKNFERALRAASGDLIALCDQDDVWRRDRLELAVAPFVDRLGLLLLHSDARLIDAAGAPIGTTLFGALAISPAERDAVHHGHAFSVFLRRNLATGATTVVRRSLVEAAVPFPPEWVHDEWLAIVAAALGGLDLVDDTLVDYRRHAANQIGVKDSTLRNKVGRVLEARGRRNLHLARHWGILAGRLRQLSAVPSAFVESAVEKARFESERAEFPRSRVRRAWPVLALARRGGYSRFASRGRADIVRDLVQPMGSYDVKERDAS